MEKNNLNDSNNWVEIHKDNIGDLLRKNYNFYDMENTDDETVVSLLERAWKRWRRHKIIEELLNYHNVWRVNPYENDQRQNCFIIYTEEYTDELKLLSESYPDNFKIEIKIN